tara:strand:+ start:445 stop:1146 length:702 start_codon:yes stop_codon:yes gene_type:complete
MTNYLFDVDGTLTPARGKIDQDFKKYFGDWVSEKRSLGDKVFLVTGSDRSKTVEQIGLPVCRVVNGCYQNCGNQLYIRNALVKESAWRMSTHLRLDILMILEKSPWNGHAENNIEERAGMINISTIGRSATPKQREAYFRWDKVANERKKIAEILSLRYPKLEFSIGGEISIDAYPKGKDKSQVLKDLSGESIFFGDSCEIGGNDYSIAIQSDRYHNVKDWKETEYIMKVYYG